MRVPNHLENQRFGFNMTPMIDVVFLLIIFFLVSMEMNKQENRMQLDLSEGDTGTRQVDEARQRVTINVDDQGNVFIAGNQMSPQQLRSFLQQRVGEAGKELEVRIRASRKVPYRMVNPIMVSCTEAGIWNVKYSIIKPQRSAS